MKKTLFLLTTLLLAIALHADQTCLPVNAPAKPDVWGMILVYLAPVLFILILIALFRWAKRDKLSLKDLLVERNLPDNHPATATGVAQLPAAANGVQSLPAEPPPSSSRLIMLLSGLAAVVVGVVLCSYNIYSLLHFGCIPESSSFTNAILALGIGVTPYATKQVFK